MFGLALNWKLPNYKKVRVQARLWSRTVTHLNIRSWPVKPGLAQNWHFWSQNAKTILIRSWSVIIGQALPRQSESRLANHFWPGSNHVCLVSYWSVWLSRAWLVITGQGLMFDCVAVLVGALPNAGKSKSGPCLHTNLLPVGIARSGQVQINLSTKNICWLKVEKSQILRNFFFFRYKKIELLPSTQEKTGQIREISPKI